MKIRCGGAAAQTSRSEEENGLDLDLPFRKQQSRSRPITRKDFYPFQTHEQTSWIIQRGSRRKTRIAIRVQDSVEISIIPDKINEFTQTDF